MMTVLLILGGAVFLFVTGWLRVDLVALMVLVSLVIAGLVTPEQALDGFSNPAVVTVWAVFILNGGLTRTGIASLLGRQVLRLAGHRELPLLVLIMLVAGFLSAFMNNVGVAALLLPVVLDISRRTRHPPSKLLIPLSFSCLLGGMTTLIGTPPNILVSGALGQFGREPFQFFDFTPVGSVVMLTGIVYMALIGRHLLPSRTLDILGPGSDPAQLERFFHLEERMFIVNLAQDSPLAGKTLAESRLRRALGFNVIGIIRDGQTRLAPAPEVSLQAGDRLLVQGNPDVLGELAAGEGLSLEEDHLDVQRLVTAGKGLAKVHLSPRSKLIGQTIREIDLRNRWGINVLAIWRAGTLYRSDLKNATLEPDDVLLVQAAADELDDFCKNSHWEVAEIGRGEFYELHERLIVVGVPPDSPLVGRTLEETRLGEAFDLTVLGIVRDGETRLVPDPAEKLRAGDTLLVEGSLDDLLAMRGLRGLEVEREATPDLSQLESEEVGLAEVVLSPHSTLAGKSLAKLDFREKYGLSVLALWREGEAYRTGLRDMALRFGDALLLHGPRHKIQILGREPNFLVLTEEAQEAPRLERAPVAVLVMAAVVATALIGWLPIYIAAVAGATVMVLTRCLTMEEAYRFIEWRAVFLIAGMLPLGTAIQQSGTAEWLATNVLSAAGALGSLAVVACLFVMTAMAAQTMPTSAVAVLMSPIAFNTALTVQMSPEALLMVVAVASSSSFGSPVAHAANVLVMGPGGYRFIDYVRVGLPLLFIVLVVVLVVLPMVWPLHP